MCYLCYFVLFCMFDDYWIINCRSQISARKSTVKTLYFWSSEISSRIQKFLFYQKMEAAKRGG